MLHYPRLMDDSEYLFKKLEPILKDVDLAQFHTVHKQTLKPDWITRG
jgi:hypothetical protein